MNEKEWESVEIFKKVAKGGMKQSKVFKILAS